MEKKDLKLRVSPTLDKQLRRLAEQYGYSYNEVAAQVLENYAALWEAAEQAKREVIAEQLGKVQARQSSVREPVKLPRRAVS